MFANVFISLAYLLYLIYLITGALWTIRTESLLSVIAMFYCMTKSSQSVVFKTFATIFALFFIMFTNIIFTGNYNIYSVLNEITSYMGLAFVLVAFPINRRFFLIQFYIIALICAVGVAVKQDLFLAKSSLNYVSVILILSMFPYYQTFKDNTERPSIIPALVSAGVCLICSGRGGIIMAFILLFGMSFNSVFVYKSRNKLLLLVYLLPIIALVYVFLYTSYFDEYLYRFTMEDGGFQDMARLNIGEEYKSVISKSSEYFFMGYPIAESPVFKHYLLNLHNSYLMTHSYMGLLGLVLLAWYSIKAFLLLIHQKRYDMITLMIAFYVRSFTDWIYPLQMGSVVIYYFILMVIFNNKYNKKNNLKIIRTK